MNKKQLIDFENWVVDTYKAGKLRSPIHLSGSVDGTLEDFLINLFKEVKPNDWVFSTYRSHYHALLKGISPEWLKKWILNNKSIHVMNKEHNFFTSAIVGGTLPIALGTAMGIKLKYPYEVIEKETRLVKNHLNDMIRPHVYVFVGDMTIRTGAFRECLDYADCHDLPITFVCEDNNLSTDTPTQEVWNYGNSKYYAKLKKTLSRGKDRIIRINYKRKYPHYGVGMFVDFKDEGLKQEGGKF